MVPSTFVVPTLEDYEEDTDLAPLSLSAAGEFQDDDVPAGLPDEVLSHSQVIGSQVGKVYSAIADYDPAEDSDKADDEIDDELVLTTGCRLQILEVRGDGAGHVVLHPRPHSSSLI